MRDSTLILPVIIIRTPGSKRIEALLRDLDRVKGISIHLLDATMIQSKQDLSNVSCAVDEVFFEYYLERKLLPSEIGCAISHNGARGLAANFPVGALILEDDAEIVDHQIFREYIITFLESNLGKSSVLSLYNWHSTKSRRNKPKEVRIYGSPKLAIGYALTPKAAHNLIVNNSPVKYLADWPPSGVTYYVSKPSFVVPRKNLISIIDPNNERFRRANAGNVITRVFGLDFFFYYKEIFSFSDYCRIRWWPRILWRIDNLKLFVSELSPN